VKRIRANYAPHAGRIFRIDIRCRRTKYIEDEAYVMRNVESSEATSI
jgi:hypothetical protein